MLDSIKETEDIIDLKKYDTQCHTVTDSTSGSCSTS